MCTEELYRGEGKVKILFILPDKEFAIVRDRAEIVVSAEETELPDTHCGYVLHKLRKEESFLISIITRDNLDLLDKKDEEEKEQEVDPEAETKKLPPDMFPNGLFLENRPFPHN